MSYPIPLVLIVVLRSRLGDRAGLPGWKKEAWRKQPAGVSLVLPEIRTKDDDEDERGLGHDAWVAEEGKAGRHTY